MLRAIVEEAALTLTGAVSGHDCDLGAGDCNALSSELAGHSGGGNFNR